MEIPKAANWVKARSECSAERLFAMLRDRAQNDLIAFRDTPAAGNAAFDLKVASDTRFFVTRAKNGNTSPETDAVAFVLGATDIRVIWARTETQLFAAAPWLCLDGECRFKVAGREGPLELWQVSQLALERLFFD